VTPIARTVVLNPEQADALASSGRRISQSVSYTLFNNQLFSAPGWVDHRRPTLGVALQPAILLDPNVVRMGIRVDGFNWMHVFVPDRKPLLIDVTSPPALPSASEALKFRTERTATSQADRTWLLLTPTILVKRKSCSDSTSVVSNWRTLADLAECYKSYRHRSEPTVDDDVGAGQKTAGFGRGEQ